ncbi:MULTISPECIES: FAD-dependent monooxygenase [Legionella]|uniref:2-polyprenyl-6-methoxyphenol hydroxylase n=1 Tax=Legionella septentrionalis TaxID=2498109 RepID=A0A3S0XUK7_9GAMM|nr:MULTISPECIES: FAD-dependent monooxygenase [Legionella]MCP0914791.1 FAD-dependent monooxygenase [Legionella sp. 27cVA30]RUQ91074.1 2-polyprenyl-6-methoxyphenol hydroxylase [Legionella septentrionalis]RUR02857.1 2-polyprenyl-6-methoxyphenol hydroxylase [Legionella septentrionalis]RUR11455.1 2-polyprenyl-6-methoxyphenol hydroxylase [Legionella septentrionalis]
MSEYYDVLVLGGGVVGLSAAIAMRQRGYSVGIVDAGMLAADIAKPDARVYAINQASQSLLQALAVWEQIIKSRISPYTNMYIWDAANQAHIEFDARMVGTDRLGTIIEESVLKQALLARAAELGVSFFANNKVHAVAPDSEEIRVAAGANAWRAKLLMIADGANSATRDLLGVELTSWPYHQQAIVVNVRTEYAHQYTAYQVFNADGPLAFLPLADAHECSIVWSTTQQRAQFLMGLSEEKFNQELTRAFAAKLGRVQIASTRYQFPLHMRHVKQYQGMRWMLMGDAAHTIHPLAGLGLNLGLEDISAWLSILDAQLAWSPKELRAYQRQRKYAVWQMIAAMQGLKTLFANPLRPVIHLRGLGLNACNQLPILKRFFIEQAAGSRMGAQF